MNYCVQDWNMEDEILTVGNQRKSMEPENELVELLWRNGQVVLQSQTHRRQGPTMNGSKQVQKPDQLTLKGGSFGNSSTLINDDETSTWIQYPLEDSLEKEFCSEFLYELPTSDPIETNKQIKPFKGDKDVKLGASEETNTLLPKSSLLRSQQLLFKQSNNSNFAENPMPPPGLQIPDSMQQGPNLGGVNRIVNFSHFSRQNKANLGMSNGLMIAPEELNSAINGEVGETSVMTIGSSHCGSNQVPNDADFGRFSSNGVGATGILTGPIKEDAQKVFPQRERGQTNMLETAVTSSSGGSGGSIGRIGKQSTSTHSQKRKGKDEDDSECQSEEAEFESAKPKKSTQRSGSVRRNRAAEVHNLSERRRRDRINEKMRALQELIPHCNKSDKASMLDEAIEYLKSLQLQLQIMWMGSSMAPMMFPGVQHYMSRMGMGMAPPPLPSIHSPMQLPRVPLVDQAISVAATPNHPGMCQTPILNPVNFQNQMQNPNYPEQYTHYMGFHPMQAVPQHMNMFGYAPQSLQQSHKITPPSNSGGPCNGGAPTNNTPKSNLATISDVNRLAHGYSCLSDAHGPLNEPTHLLEATKLSWLLPPSFGTLEIPTEVIWTALPPSCLPSHLATQLNMANLLIFTNQRNY